MKKIFIAVFLLITLFLSGCSQNEEAPSSTATVSSEVESVELEYFTDEEGEVHKISDIVFADADLNTDWSEISGLPDDFPELTDKVTTATSYASSVNIKWNILPEEDSQSIVALLEKWAGTCEQEDISVSISKYKFVKTNDNYEYTVDYIYQPYADGTSNEQTGEYFAQGEIYIYKSKTDTADNISSENTDSQPETENNED